MPSIIKRKRTITMLKIYGAEHLPKAEELSKAIMSVLGQRTNLYVELSFVEKDEIKKLNAQMRGVDAVTDVLSFPMIDGIRGRKIYKKDFPLDYNIDEKAIFLGSTVVCMDKVRQQAIEFGHSEERETYYLIVHSILHLFGYDHETEDDKKQMRNLEEKIMDKLGIQR